MKSGFLNFTVFLTILCSIYYETFSPNELYFSIAVGAGFLMVAFHYISHHFDFSKTINQIFLVASLLMFLPAVLQNLNFPGKAYETIFASFYGFSIFLTLLIFWIEDHAKEYNKNLLLVRIILFISGFALTNLYSPLDEPYKKLMSFLLAIGLFISPNYFLRWKFQSTRNFRFGLVAGFLLLLSLFLTAFSKTTSNFLPVGPLQVIAFYMVSVPFIKDKVLPNWLVLRFRNVEKTKRRIRRRERFRYKRAMEQENN